jgi:uncharacterized protein YggT (Ycf19 family)
MRDTTKLDDKLAQDESSRIAQHEQAKDEFRQQVHREVKNIAETSKTPDANVREAAHELKQKAASEVAGTEMELERAKKAARTSQIVDYVFYLIYGIIGLEIVLELLAARESNWFKQFIDAISTPFLGPFRGLLWDPSLGSSRLMFSYIIALVVWILVHFAVNGLLRMFVHKKTAV